MPEPVPSCDLCATDGGVLAWRDDFCRVVLAGEPDYPGFCRVVLNRHAREMTDLDPGERWRLMGTVFAVEAAVRRVMNPDKMNLASLGNAVAHLHWHVIPRYIDDRHFPRPIWGAPQREGSRTAPENWAERLATEIINNLPARG